MPQKSFMARYKRIVRSGEITRPATAAKVQQLLDQYGPYISQFSNHLQHWIRVARAAMGRYKTLLNRKNAKARREVAHRQQREDLRTAIAEKEFAHEWGIPKKRNGGDRSSIRALRKILKRPSRQDELTHLASLRLQQRAAADLDWVTNWRTRVRQTFPPRPEWVTHRLTSKSAGPESHSLSDGLFAELVVIATDP